MSGLLGVGGDREVAGARGRSAAAASEESPGWAGCIARGDLGADRPGLGVGLVEEDAGELGLGRHGGNVRRGTGGSQCGVCAGFAQQSCGVDGIDRKILALLVEDGRRTFDDIGARVGLSAPSVKRRVDRLRESGRAARDSRRSSTTAALGGDTEALVELFYAPGTLLDEVAKTLRGHPEVVEAWSVTGEADAIARVRTEDNARPRAADHGPAAQRARRPHPLAGGALAAGQRHAGAGPRRLKLSRGLPPGLPGH